MGGVGIGRAGRAPRSRSIGLAAPVVALLAGCAAGASSPPRTSSSTGELTAQEACLDAHALSVGPARRDGSVVRLTFGDGAHDSRLVVYQVHRRPADRSTSWVVVANLRRSPSLGMVYTDAAAPPVALAYGVTAEGICGGRTSSHCGGDPCSLVIAPAVAGSPASD
jgi:hypothetical protein